MIYCLLLKMKMMPSFKDLTEEPMLLYELLMRRKSGNDSMSPGGPYEGTPQHSPLNTPGKRNFAGARDGMRDGTGQGGDNGASGSGRSGGPGGLMGQLNFLRNSGGSLRGGGGSSSGGMR